MSKDHESERLDRLEHDMRKMVGVFRHGMMGKGFGYGPGPALMMIDRMHDRDFDFYDEHAHNRKDRAMPKLPAPATITADTADELITKTAEAEAQRQRVLAISELADVVEAADAARESAREKLTAAKAARKAVKHVRNDPEASIEDIREAIKVAKTYVHTR